MPTRKWPCQGNERGPLAALMPGATKPSRLAGAHGDAPGVGPLEQRNEVLTADTQALANRGRLDLACASDIPHGLGKSVERFDGVISVALDRFDQPTTGSKAQGGHDVPAPGLPLQLRHARRRETGALQDLDEAQHLRLTA